MQASLHHPALFLFGSSCLSEEIHRFLTNPTTDNSGRLPVADTIRSPGTALNRCSCSRASAVYVNPWFSQAVCSLISVSIVSHSNQAVESPCRLLCILQSRWTGPCRWMVSNHFRSQWCLGLRPEPFARIEFVIDPPHKNDSSPRPRRSTQLQRWNGCSTVLDKCAENPPSCHACSA